MLLAKGVCCDQCVLLAKLLAFALLHFVLQSQICVLFQLSLDSILLNSKGWAEDNWLQEDVGGVADKVKRCSRHETIGCAAMRVLAVPNDLGAGWWLRALQSRRSPVVARRLLAVKQWEAVAHQVKHTGSHDTVALLRWGQAFCRRSAAAKRLFTVGPAGALLMGQIPRGLGDDFLWGDGRAVAEQSGTQGPM